VFANTLNVEAITSTAWQVVKLVLTSVSESNDKYRSNMATVSSVGSGWIILCSVSQVSSDCDWIIRRCRKA